MNIKNLKQYEGIICPTKKILKKILKLNNDTRISPNSCFSIEEIVVYYPICYLSESGWSSLDYAKYKQYKIHSHKKFLKPSLKKRVQKTEKGLDEIDRILASVITNNNLK